MTVQLDRRRQRYKRKSEPYQKVENILVNRDLPEKECRSAQMKYTHSRTKQTLILFETQLRDKVKTRGKIQTRICQQNAKIRGDEEFPLSDCIGHIDQEEQQVKCGSKLPSTTIGGCGCI